MRGQGSAKIESAARALGQKPSKSRIQSFVTDTVVPAVDQQISGLRDLPPPAGDEDTVKAILDAVDEGLAKVKADPGAITASSPFAKANKLSNEYGLTVCDS